MFEHIYRLWYYDDRQINEYKVGKDVLYEAEKIKRELMEFEHDLWEY